MREALLIDLIRHGEAVGGRRYRGQIDDPLSEAGWQQMWAAVGDFHGWQRIVTSPLQRCATFAEALGARIDVPVTRDARLMECAFGEWEGMTPEAIERGDAGRLFRFRRDPAAHAPGGAEPLQAFYARVAEAWEEWLRQDRGRHLLVVAHAGVIRMVLAGALGLPPEHAYRLSVGNAALSRIRVEWEDGLMLPTLLFHEGKL